MRIAEINSEEIRFDNGNTITFDHSQDWCEWNYADFEQLDDLAKNYNFNENQMRFEFVDGSGFRFGDNRMMHFVPCYSDQNGYYSDEIDIYYNGEKVCDGAASQDC